MKYTALAISALIGFALAWMLYTHYVFRKEMSAILDQDNQDRWNIVVERHGASLKTTADVLWDAMRSKDPTKSLAAVCIACEIIDDYRYLENLFGLSQSEVREWFANYYQLKMRSRNPREKALAAQFIERIAHLRERSGVPFSDLELNPIVIPSLRDDHRHEGGANLEFQH